MSHNVLCVCDVAHARLGPLAARQCAAIACKLRVIAGAGRVYRRRAALETVLTPPRFRAGDFDTSRWTMPVATGHDADLVRFLPDVFLFRRGDGAPAEVLADIVGRWWPDASPDEQGRLVDLLVTLLEPPTYPHRSVTWDVRDRCTALVETWQRQQALASAEAAARRA